MDENDNPATNMFPQNKKEYILAKASDDFNIEIHQYNQDTFSKAFNQIFCCSSFLKPLVNDDETDNQYQSEDNKTNRNNNFQINKNENLCNKVYKHNKEDEKNLQKQIKEKIESIPTKVLVIAMSELDKIISNEKNKDNQLNELLLEKKIINELLKRVILAIQMKKK